MPLRALALLATTLVAATVSDGGRGHAPPPAFDFRFDVLPVLHRQGCGSAYCHGSANGRGGFKLSLFGSEPVEDHHAIAHALGGRRLDLVDPDASLLLQKPTLRVEHGGGHRLTRGGADYARLRAWIADGAPMQAGAPIELRDLAVELDADRVRAVATFVVAGGTADATVVERDVTSLCTFSSSDDRIASVDRDGVVAVGGRGRAWIFVRYVHCTARVAVVRPFDLPPTREPDGSRAVEGDGSLDAAFVASLAELGLRPAAAAPRAVLARRLYLDLVGRPPDRDELRAFVAGDAIDVVAQRLMQTEAFATTFARHLCDWFEVPRTDEGLPAPQAQLFATERAALVAAVARGDSLEAIVRRFVIDDRRLLDRLADPRDRAELCGRAVFGVRIGCARCHDSPNDRWRRRDHLAFSALFASPRPAPDGGMRAGVLFHPETRAPVAPALLPVPGAAPMPITPELSSAEQVVRFAFDADNELFARNIANRIFAAVIGRGLVEPLDDHRLGNPALHEPVLARLAAIARAGDLRAVVHAIVTSRLYATTSEAGPDEQRAFLCRREARALEPEVFASAVAHVLGGAPRPVELPRSPLARELALQNGDLLHDAIAASPALATIARLPDGTARVHALFERALSRPPRPAELDAFAEACGGDEQALADAAFALLAGREFASIR